MAPAKTGLLPTDHRLMPTPKSISTDIVRRLQQAGFAAFWVGGCVRDFLLGRIPDDYDIATSARPGQVEALFRRTLAVGRKFGVMAVLEEGHQFQVATFRAEADYQDGRRPETVHFADARADALRRDFTVNGLFFDPVSETLHDWVGGGADLRARILRTIGAPAERFAEDHLRLLRAVRFATQLDFQIEPATYSPSRHWLIKSKSSAPSGSVTNCSNFSSPPTRHGVWNCCIGAGCSSAFYRNWPPRCIANSPPITTRKAASSTTFCSCWGICRPRPILCCPGPSCSMMSPSR